MASNMTAPGAHHHTTNSIHMNDYQKFQIEPSLTQVSSRTSSRSQINGTKFEIPGTFGRSSVFGSCVQVLGIVTTTLFQTIADFKFYTETTSDNNTIRKAKLLYVSLLEKVQKERGEWCGFEENITANKDKKKVINHMEVLKIALEEMTREDALAVLNELMEVSFRNLRGSLVASDLYTRHKKVIASAGMGCPPPLNTLLVVRNLLNEMEQDEKVCLFRLLSLWHVIVVANVHQDLRRIIEEKHTLVFSESDEMDFMTTSSRHKGNRYDPIAVGLLQVLVQYREILFSDIEFLLIKQELQFPQNLLPPSTTTLAATSARAAQKETSSKKNEESQPQQSETEYDELEMDHHNIPLAVAVEEVSRTEEEDEIFKSNMTTSCPTNSTGSSNYASPRGRFQSAVSATGTTANSSATTAITGDNKNGSKPHIVAVRVERAQSCASPTYSATHHVKDTSIAIAPVQHLSSSSPIKSPVAHQYKISRRKAKQLQKLDSSSEEDDEEESDESENESYDEEKYRSNGKKSSKSSSNYRNTRHKSHKKRSAFNQKKQNSADERAIASYVALSVAVTICAVATIAIFAVMKTKRLQ